MSEIEQSGFFEFDRWLGLARRTRELLAAAVDDGGLPAGGADYLADRTLPHVEGVQVGFLGWLRADTAGIAELRFLLSRVASTRVEPALDEPERRAAAAEEAMERTFALRAGRPARSLQTPEPWNLADGCSSRNGELLMTTASAAPPRQSIAGGSRPLSGPTRRWPSAWVRTATARRGPPTPGSTIARCTPTGA